MAGAADFYNAYNIYAVLLTVSTAGLPVAVSKLVSEANALDRRNQVRRTFRLALVLFLTLLCSMSGLPALETHLKDRSNHLEVHLELKNKLDLPGFVSTVRALGIRIDDIESNPAYLNSGLSVFTVSFTVSSAELKQYKKHGEIIEALRSLDYIYHINEET